MGREVNNTPHSLFFFKEKLPLKRHLIIDQNITSYAVMGNDYFRLAYFDEINIICSISGNRQ